MTNKQSSRPQMKITTTPLVNKVSAKQRVKPTTTIKAKQQILSEEVLTQ